MKSLRAHRSDPQRFGMAIKREPRAHPAESAVFCEERLGGREREEESHGSPYSELVCGRPSLLWKRRVHLCCWRRRVRDRVSHCVSKRRPFVSTNGNRVRKRLTVSLAGRTVCLSCGSLYQRAALFWGSWLSSALLYLLHSSAT